MQLALLLAIFLQNEWLVLTSLRVVRLIGSIAQMRNLRDVFETGLEHTKKTCILAIEESNVYEEKARTNQGNNVNVVKCLTYCLHPICVFSYSVLTAFRRG